VARFGEELLLWVEIGALPDGERRLLSKDPQGTRPADPSSSSRPKFERVVNLNVAICARELIELFPMRCRLRRP
jgi:hypothetical protein